MSPSQRTWLAASARARMAWRAQWVCGMGSALIQSGSHARDTAASRADQPIVRRSTPKTSWEVGKAMGTWDVEPFGNDDAADFANDLDEASTQDRIEMIGSVL